MKAPTPEELTTAKATAIKAFAAKSTPERVDRLVGIEVDAPVDTMVVAVPLNLDAYCAYYDARRRDHETAQASLFVDRVIWPAQDVALEMMRTWPALVVHVENELMGAAGANTQEATLAPLDARALPRWLPADVAQKLLTDAKGPRLGAAGLWTVYHPAFDLGLVFRSPLPDVYHATRAAFREAINANSGAIRSYLRATLECVLWSPRPMAEILDETPALAEDLMEPFFNMGGAGATSRRRFL